MGLVLNYTEAIYQGKVNELNRLIERLKLHVNRLEELRDELEKYWDDESAREYYRIISTQIRAVRNSLNRTMSLHDFYQSAMDEIGSKQALTDGVVEDANLILQALSIEGE